MTLIDELVKAIVFNPVVWIPIVTFILLQILKVAFSLGELLNDTIFDVLMTSGTELAVIAISIHFAALGCTSCWIAERYNSEESSLLIATNVYLVLYVIAAIVSFFVLRLAKARIEEYKSISISPGTTSRQGIGAMMNIGAFLTISFGAGLIALLLAVRSIE